MTFNLDKSSEVDRFARLLASLQYNQVKFTVEIDGENAVIFFKQ